MVFNSFEFLVFFPIVLLLYFILPKTARWVMLLCASYYFYISWNVSLIWLILFTTAVSYAAALFIGRIKEKYPDGKHRGLERLLLIIALTVCFGVLFFFKYFNFLADSVLSLVNLFSGHSHSFALDLILPVGISFYTFQTLSYVIDVYRGTIKVERHFGYYALYVSFFPQLVAGPIERPENLIPQLRQEHPFDWGNATSGLCKMLVGFFKKVVVADLLATYVNAVYNDPESANGFTVLLATVLFAFQIYCDFSGYTDIAIGCSEIMGIRLMQNFDRPYTAQSIKEFWRRWHISLSSWFRDYLYFPLGGSRVKKYRHLLNVLIVFLVSGLWHGAAWTFLIWGGLHGLYQVIGELTKKPRAKLFELLHIDPTCRTMVFLRRAFTFLLVCFAWIFFRANSFSDLATLLAKLFTDWSLEPSYFVSALEKMGMTALSALTCLLSVLVLHILDKGALAQKSTAGSPLPARYVFTVWAILAAWFILLMGDGASTFIYFQF